MQDASTEYDTWHSAQEPDDGQSDPWHKLLFSQLPEDLSGKTVLEIGCGRGGLSRRVATLPRPPKQVIGADFSAVAVAKASRGTLPPNLSFSQQDIQAIGFSDNHFDVVISCETIEHVPDTRKAIHELARVLRPGGQLYLTVPNYFSSLGLYRVYLRLRGREFREAGQPINQATMLPVISRWVRRAGMRIRTVRAVGHYIPFPGRPPIRVPWLDGVPGLSLIAQHSLIVAEKLG